MTPIGMTALAISAYSVIKPTYDSIHEYIEQNKNENNAFLDISILDGFEENSTLKLNSTRVEALITGDIDKLKQYSLVEKLVDSITSWWNGTQSKLEAINLLCEILDLSDIHEGDLSHEARVLKAKDNFAILKSLVNVEDAEYFNFEDTSGRTIFAVGDVGLVTFFNHAEMMKIRNGEPLVMYEGVILDQFIEELQEEIKKTGAIALTPNGMGINSLDNQEDSALNPDHVTFGYKPPHEQFV